MKMKTLYAAISGAIIFGAATLSPAQTTGSNAGASPAKKETTEIGTGITPGTIDASKPGSAEKRTKTPRLGALDPWEAERDRIESAHKVAKEKCEDQKGEERKACKKQAKADERKAIAEAKKARQVASAKGSTERKARNGGTTLDRAKDKTSDAMTPDSKRDGSVAGGKEETTKGAQTSGMMKPDGANGNIQTTQSGTDSTAGKKY